MKKLYALSLIIFIPAVLLSQSVFINEIHYDNVSTDANEGVEIAGPAGTNLTGWNLQPYNGMNGEPYSTTPLSGIIPDLENGFGTLWFPIASLQNGSPDGVALVDNTSTLIQFLSYEGGFTAVGGAADGITSEDILVSQNGDADGLTIQLQGTGNDYSSFSWSTGVVETRGAVNNGQTLVDIDPPVWTSGYPTLTNILDTRGDLTVNMDEEGITYFMVLADGDAAPTSDQVKAGVPYDAVTPIYPGSFVVETANTDILFVIAGATPETDYDIYVVAEDALENLQSVPIKFDATTTAARSLEITSPAEKETYTTGQSITFTWTSANISNIYIGGFNYRYNDFFYIAEDGSGNPEPVDATLGSYSFTIPNDAALDSLAIIMWDVADTSFKDIVNVVYMSDLIPPEADEVWPANNDINVPASASFYIYFNEEVYPNAGKIYIRDEAGTLFEEFDILLAGPGQALEFADNNYRINISPSNNLLAGTKYYIEMDAGVVMDYFDNEFGGISGITNWSFTIAGTLSIENDLTEKLHIYPVPASTELTISNIDGVRSLEVLDLTGSRVFSTGLNRETEYKLDLTRLPRGVYFLRLNSVNRVVTKKFIKK